MIFKRRIGEIKQNQTIEVKNKTEVQAEKYSGIKQKKTMEETI